MTLINLEWPDDFRPFYGDEDAANPRALLGTAYIFGSPFHVQAVRVERSPDGQQVVPRDPDLIDPDDDEVRADCDTLLTNLALFEGGAAFVTVELPGRAGEWVLWITPHQE